MMREEQIEQLIYDMLSVDKNNAGYVTVGFAVAYALLQCAAALNRIADEVSRDE